MQPAENISAQYVDHQVKSQIKVVVHTKDELSALVRQLNARQRAFLDHVFYALKYERDLKVFLTGGAGVGKSKLIKAIDMLVSHFYYRSVRSSPDMVTVLKLAPTGMAAFNIGGSTPHSALRIPMNAGWRCNALPMKTCMELQMRLLNVRMLIIDEVSMMGIRMLSWVEKRLRQILNRPDELFGGAHVILVGDLFQLPPVNDRFCFEDPEEFDNYIWPEFQLFELTEVMRQKNASFASLLNRVREGHQKPEDIVEMQKMCFHSVSSVPADLVTNIFVTNNRVNSFNKRLFRNQALEHSVIIPARDVDQVTNKVTKSFDADEVEADSGKKKSGFRAALKKRLRLYIGAKVQMTYNVDTQDGLVNGASGIVVHFSRRLREDRVEVDELHMDGSRCLNDSEREAFLTQKGRLVEIIWVRFQDPDVGLQRRKTMFAAFRDFNIQDKKLVPIVRIENTSIKVSSGHPICRIQFPLQHRSATTVHKTQGLTLEYGSLRLSGHRPQPGRFYVALSRFTNPNHVVLDNFNCSDIIQHPGVQMEMARLRRTPLTLHVLPLCDLIQEKVPSSLTLLLQNVQSLHKHWEDIKCIKGIEGIDLTLFVETMLENPLDQYRKLDNSIRTTVGSFVEEVSHVEGGLLACCRSRVTLIHKQQDARMEIMAFFVKNLKIILLHKKPSCPDKEFSIELQKVLRKRLPEEEFHMQPTVVLGDFNFNIATDILNPIASQLTSCRFTQLLRRPTNIHNRVIDQIWISDADMVKKVVVLESYHSDHYPIFLHLDLSVPVVQGVSVPQARRTSVDPTPGYVHLLASENSTCKHYVTMCWYSYESASLHYLTMPFFCLKQVCHPFRIIDSQTAEINVAGMICCRKGRFDTTKDGNSKLGVMDQNGDMREIVFWKDQFSDWGGLAQSMVDDMPHNFALLATYLFHNLRPSINRKANASR
jgi:ATP-dependent DNA helicase PIF1